MSNSDEYLREYLMHQINTSDEYLREYLGKSNK